MSELTELVLPRHQMDALISLAARAEALTATERFAVADAQAQIRDADLRAAEKAANTDPRQLELFDASEYDA